MWGNWVKDVEYEQSKKLFLLLRSCLLSLIYCMWQSALRDFAVAMAMSCLEYLFIHLLLQTYKNESNAAYLHLILSFLYESIDEKHLEKKH